jgi:hypothetical protein
MDVSIAGLYAWLDLEKDSIAMMKRDCATQLPITGRGASTRADQGTTRCARRRERISSSDVLARRRPRRAPSVLDTRRKGFR